MSTVVIIDDNPEGAPRLLEHELAALGASVRLRSPQQVSMEDLADAEVILVDFKLDDWPERNATQGTPCMCPLDGLAVAAVLRRQVRQRPTAIALITQAMEDLARPLPPTNRHHTLASLNGLEWIFKKGEAETGRRIHALGHAVRELPQDWPRGAEAVDSLGKMLKIPSGDCHTSCLQDVQACLPPLHELSEWSHGLAVIRWFLQRILPYPCFLLDTFRLAAVFRVDPASLRDTLSTTDSKLRQSLQDCEYNGILSAFGAPRWWRAAVDQLLWEKTKGMTWDLDAVANSVSDLAGKDLGRSGVANPVVCVDANYEPVELRSPDEAVRVRPDGWPEYADSAWIAIEMADQDGFWSSVMLEEDRARLHASE